MCFRGPIPGRRQCRRHLRAVAGQVVIGGQTRFILQPGEESIEIYYLLDILNNSAVPVNPPTPFAFDMPSGAMGTGILQGSSPLASLNGLRISVNGPFPPGSTHVQIGTAFTVTSGSFDLVQRFPAALTDYAVIVKRVGDTKMGSYRRPRSRSTCRARRSSGPRVLRSPRGSR